LFVNAHQAERLRRELADGVGPITVEELRARDILFVHPNPRVAAALAAFVHDFLSPRPYPEDN
jgi:hypothetical protein